MSYEIVFGADGCVSFPDLPDALLPAVEALNAPLPHPAAQAAGEEPPAWWRTRRTAVGLKRADLAQASASALWAIHRAALDGDLDPTSDAEQPGGATLLDLKIELACRSLSACDLCAHQCGADRWAGERGACGSALESRTTRCFLNWSEERELTPGISVFLSGCNWRCVYCQYPENLDASAGTIVEPERLAQHIEELWREGGTNIHWVGGNPDQHVWAALGTLRACGAPIPVVWNSNGYASQTTLRLLEGVVDTHIVDFRHWSPACASRYGVPAEGAEIIRRNLRIIAAQGADLIVRHLQLPGHFECCTAPILRWLAEQLPSEPPRVRLNLMHGQYRPAFEVHRTPEINRRLSPEERARSERLARALKLPQVEGASTMEGGR